MDHFSWSAFGGQKGDSVNGHVYPLEKLRHDTIDCFAEVSVLLIVAFGSPWFSFCVGVGGLHE